MTLKTKVDGAWKEASSLKVKIGGEWKDIDTLYSKKDGTWTPVYSSEGVSIIVKDESGNVVSGAAISIEVSPNEPYDFSSAYWVDVSTESNKETFELHGVEVIGTTKVARLVASGVAYGDSTGNYSIELPVDSPNGTYQARDGHYPGEGGISSVILTAYDADGNVLQTAEIPQQ